MNRIVLMLAGFLCSTAPVEATALEVDVSNDLTELMFGTACGYGNCPVMISSAYLIPSGATWVNFGSADFYGAVDNRQDFCLEDVTICLGSYGTGFIRFLFSPTDDEHPDWVSLPDTLNDVECQRFDCPVFTEGLGGVVPAGALKAQLVIGNGYFDYHPPVIPTMSASPVPLPSGLLLFLGGLGCLGLFWRMSEARQ